MSTVPSHATATLRHCHGGGRQHQPGTLPDGTCGFMRLRNSRDVLPLAFSAWSPAAVARAPRPPTA